MKYMVCVLLTLATLGLTAQEKRLTVESIFKGEIQPARISRGYTWQPDGKHYLKFESGKGWMRVSAADETAELYLSSEKIKAAFLKQAGFTEKAAESLAKRRFVTWNSAQDAVLYNTRNDLFVYRMDTDEAIRLTHDAAEEVGQDFSPDGTMVSFIRDYNIHLVDLQTREIRQVTKDGSKSLLYGRLDWVYQEEVYGRGNFRGYWWSPDGASLAFLRIDESDVPTYTVVDHIPYHPKLEVTHYPKAGDPNPKTAIGVVPTMGGSIQWMDTFDYEGGEFLVVRVGWHPDGQSFTAQIQDREQTWLDLVHFDPATGKGKRLLRETSKTWVDVIGNPHWTPGGKHFVWASERDGWRHLYLYDAEGALVRRLTKGKWEATSHMGFSEDGNFFYFAENKGNILDRYIARVELETGKMTRLSEGSGQHSARLSPGAYYFFDFHSSALHNGTLELRDGSGKLVRQMADADMSPLDPYELSKPEFLKVKTRDGFVMEAMMIKPPGFDKKKKYPVMSYTYSGPHAPQVRNRWGGNRYLWHQMLARDLNCIIWICDNRTASGKGKVSTDPLYMNFGELELQDLEDGMKWLIKQGYVDEKRIGIWGWSYGGYMTLYTLTHSKMFSVGISGAPVTDWRDYDTIYTERYMKMPQNNREGYIKTSPVHAAKNLHGKLLIIHGTMDDNVHLQNTIQMIYALQNESIPFEMMLYPRARHGVRKPAHVLHMYNMMTEFLKRNL
ncbi:MAG: S9 family peptidase [Acidobacteriota bacterium]|nr:S9 family peptidase [Acidobacteriota bacterium]